MLAEAFLDLKHDIDKKLDDLFTSDMFMLADGYAGSTTISVSLVEKNHITITTTPLPPNANYTPPVSAVPGNHGGWTLGFVDFNSGVPPVCSLAMPSQSHFYLPKQNRADRGTNQTKGNKTKPLKPP